MIKLSLSAVVNSSSPSFQMLPLLRLLHSPPDACDGAPFCYTMAASRCLCNAHIRPPLTHQPIGAGFPHLLSSQARGDRHSSSRSSSSSTGGSTRSNIRGSRRSEETEGSETTVGIGTASAQASGRAAGPADCSFSVRV